MKDMDLLWDSRCNHGDVQVCLPFLGRRLEWICLERSQQFNSNVADDSALQGVTTRKGLADTYSAFNLGKVRNAAQSGWLQLSI